MSKTRMLSIAATCILSTACANSASHRVLSVNKATDSYLSCKEIRIEKAQAQSIIYDIERDKSDMSGADVVDGLLWFPFNVIAKQSNYSNATKAAEARLLQLAELEVSNGCRVLASDKATDSKITEQLQSLNNLYRAGLLTDAELLSKRESVLGQIGDPETRVGEHSSNVLTLAKAEGCMSDSASEIVKDGDISYYQVECSNKSPQVFKCDSGSCSPTS